MPANSFNPNSATWEEELGGLPQSTENWSWNICVSEFGFGRAPCTKRLYEVVSDPWAKADSPNVLFADDCVHHTDFHRGKCTPRLYKSCATSEVLKTYDTETFGDSCTLQKDATGIG